MFHEIEQKFDDISIEVSLENNTDTLIIYGKKSIVFNYDFGGRKLLEGEIFIDNNSIHPFFGTPLEIDANDYEYGYHLLKLEIEIESGTGSLANKLEAEVLELQIEKVIFIDNLDIPTPEIVKTEIENGYLKYYWNKYQGTFFESYSNEVRYDITNINDTSQVIPYYAGGEISFSIDYHAKDQRTRASYQYCDSLNINTQVQGNTLSIIWDQSPYYNAFESYRVRGRNSFNSPSNFDIIQTDVGQSSYDVLLNRFPYKWVIDAWANHIPIVNETIVSSTSLSFPEALPGFSKAISNSYEEIFILANDVSGKNILSKFNVNDRKLIGQVKGLVDISSNGKNIFWKGGNQIHKIDPITFSIVESHSILDNPIIDDVFFISPSNTGIIALGVHYLDTSKTYLFDWNSKTVVNEFDHSLLSNFSLSASGNFLYWNLGSSSKRMYIYNFQTESLENYEDKLFIASNDRIINAIPNEYYSSNVDGSNRIDFTINEDLGDISAHSSIYFSAMSKEAPHRINLYSLNNGTKILHQDIEVGIEFKSNYFATNTFLFTAGNEDGYGSEFYLKKIEQ